MNPKHLKPHELVQYSHGAIPNPSEWVVALANALEEELEASEDVQKELDEAQKRIELLEIENFDYAERLDSSGEVVSALAFDIEELRGELRDARKAHPDVF